MEILEREVIVLDGSTPQGVPLSPAIKVGNLVFTSGQVGVSPETGQMVEGGVIEQARQVLENIAAVLKAAGTSMDRVVKTTVFVTDIEYRVQIGPVYSQYFPVAPPARSAVAVKDLAGGALIEIEAIAVT